MTHDQRAAAIVAVLINHKDNALGVLGQTLCDKGGEGRLHCRCRGCIVAQDHLAAAATTTTTTAPTTSAPTSLTFYTYTSTTAQLYIVDVPLSPLPAQGEGGG